MASVVLQPENNQNFVIDCVLSVSSSREYDITRHAVEGGAPVTDSIKKKQTPLVLDCIIPDRPSGIQIPFFNDLVNDAVIGEQQSYPKQIYDYLNRLADDLTPFTIDTRYNLYSDMYIEKISDIERVENSLGYQFQITFQPIRFVSSDISEKQVPVSTQTQDRAAARDNQGRKKGTAETTQETDTRDKSLAKSIAGAL